MGFHILPNHLLKPTRMQKQTNLGFIVVLQYSRTRTTGVWCNNSDSTELFVCPFKDGQEKCHYFHNYIKWHPSVAQKSHASPLMSTIT